MLPASTPEQAALREQVAQWATRFGEGVAERELRHEFDRDAWAQVCESGILRLPFPEAYGGLDQDLLSTLASLEELGRGCEDGGLCFAITTHLVSSGVAINRFGNAEQKQRFLPAICDGSRIGAHAITEPQGGSDAFQMKTRARRDGDSYVLNGSKTFISNAPFADLILVYAMTDPARGALGGVSVFIVERGTPGLSVGKPIEKMGLRSAPFAEVFLDDCRVSEANRLGAEGLGFGILDYVMKWEILASFCVSTGAMRRRLDRCVAYAKQRKQFGQPISSYQAISHKLVDMKMRLETARLWLFSTAQKFQAGANVSTDLAIAKLLASESNVQSALDAIQIFGGYGYTVEYGMERELRDAVGGTLYSGTSEVQRNRIAALMGA